MSDFKQCEVHEPISTPHCPICLLEERDALRQKLEQAETEKERVRQANLDVMMHFEDMRAAKEKAEAQISDLEDFCANKIGRLPLPDDRTIFADGRFTAFREVYDEARRLRQQADELEKGETSNG